VSEVAKALSIGRASVYRALEDAGSERERDISLDRVKMILHHSLISGGGMLCPILWPLQFLRPLRRTAAKTMDYSV
jgi:hypothetical protein